MTAAQARRLALRATGFSTQLPDREPGWRQIRTCIEQMGALQIDAVNAVVRSHYMPVYSRLGVHDCALLDQHLFSTKAGNQRHRRFFEYWGHECSLLPLPLYPQFAWRRADAASGVGIYRSLREFARNNQALLKHVGDRIREQGAMSTSDFDGAKRGPGMWEWSDSKIALEYLFWTGELAAAGRHSFKRIYDLAERVIPDNLRDCVAARTEAIETLLLRSAQALGVGTEADFRDYYRLPLADTRKGLASLVEKRRLLPVAVEGWDKQAYVLPDTRVPRTIAASTLLTPFDPVVWNRQRCQRLFDFHYRIEIYVPEAKRQYGYYVMPFLFGDQIVARLDLKADRESSALLVKGIWFEAGVDKKAMEPVIDEHLHQTAEWLSLDWVEYRQPS